MASNEQVQQPSHVVLLESVELEASDPLIFVQARLGSVSFEGLGTGRADWNFGELELQGCGMRGLDFNQFRVNHSAKILRPRLLKINK